MDITELKTQSLATSLGPYLVCRSCRVVDRDAKRMQRGHSCQTCGNISDSGLMYFHVNILVLIDLVQESFHSSRPSELDSPAYEGVSASDVSVTLFYCTLREALLENLIGELFRAQNIPNPVRERLLGDNRLYSQKQNKLLSSLIEKKWGKAIEEISRASGIDYSSLDEYTISVVEARNSFVHEGSKWDITHQMAEECLRNVPRLLEQYVMLHNHYVHPHYVQ